MIVRKVTKASLLNNFHRMKVPYLALPYLWGGQALTLAQR